VASHDFRDGNWSSLPDGFGYVFKLGGPGDSGWSRDSTFDNRAKDGEGNTPLQVVVGRPRRGRKVDIRLPGKRNSNSHGAWPVHLIITMIKWIRTSRLSIKNSLSRGGLLKGGRSSLHQTVQFRAEVSGLRVEGSSFAVYGCGVRGWDAG